MIEHSRFSTVRNTIVACALALGVAVAAVPNIGCYGSFTATHKIHAWNGTIQNKFLRTLAFWGLIIIPVYEVLMLGDGIIFNVIEFWSGSNPIASANTRAYADGSVELKTGEKVYLVKPSGEQRFTLFQDGVHVADGLLTEKGLVFTDRTRKETQFIAKSVHQGLQKRVGQL